VDDALSGVLDRLCAPGWHAECVVVASGQPVNVRHGFGSLLLVRRGQIQLQDAEGAESGVEAAAGEILLLTHGTAHRVCALASPESSSSSLLYGTFPLAAMGRNPFLSILPALVRIDSRSHLMLENCTAIADLAELEQRAAASGWRASVGRLAQWLFVQALRAYLSTTEFSGQAHWLRAAADPVIGPVLRRIHAEPELPWTVHSLAKESTLAKSAFSERFRVLVGQPPLEYLTGYRMQRACELLWTTEHDIKEIALRVGYESASSFSTAFKRQIGRSPAEYRKLAPPDAGGRAD